MHIISHISLPNSAHSHLTLVLYQPQRIGMLSDDELLRLKGNAKCYRLHVGRMRARELLQFIKMLRDLLPALVVVGTAKQNIARPELTSP